MYIESLSDQGTVKHAEDMLIFNPPFLGVLDGVSSLYTVQPKMFDDLTDGQLICKIIGIAFAKAQKFSSLEHVLKMANESVRDLLQKNENYDISRSETLPGATFSVVKINDKTIEIMQAGDALALTVLKNNKFDITKNQLLQHEAECNRIIARLMKEHDGDRKKVWEQFAPELTKLRQKHVNQTILGGYGLLNGQYELENCWSKKLFKREEVSEIFLFTDGLISFKETVNPEKLAHKIIELYREGGLHNILNNTRQVEDKEKNQSHIDYAEATALIIRF